MIGWNYIRFCPYCQKDKKYLSKYSKNNKTRCIECAEKYHKHNKKTFHCQNCNRLVPFKTNDIREFFEHSITCGVHR